MDAQNSEELLPAVAAETPRLSELRLSAAETAALARQGFVSCERRGGTVIYKLRFRVAGQQCTRYLGVDPQRAEQVRCELQQLQAVRRLDQELGRLRRAALQVLRNPKPQLELGLASRGYHFHGWSVRKSRRWVP